MQDERRATLVTVSVCAAIVLIGVLARLGAFAGIAAGAFAMARFGGSSKRRKLRRGLLSHRQKLAEELELGQAHVIICRATRVIERKEFEDEGAFWIFDGGDGRYLAICGQNYYEKPRFPSSNFEVVMGARHRLVIGIRSIGQRVPPTHVVKGNDVTWNSFPATDITVFTAPANAELPVILRGLDNAVAGMERQPSQL
jgi:hypothetical protein